MIGSLVGLSVAATFLPGPSVWLALLGGTDFNAAVGGGSGIGATAQAAILLAAGLLVWTLLIWGLIVTGTALLGRLPGAPGRLGRVVLRRIAPAAAGRLVAAAVGVSILAGTSACAVPALAGDGFTTGGASTGAVAAAGSSDHSPTAPTVAPTVTTDGPNSPDPGASTELPAPAVVSTSVVSTSGAVVLSFSIDWPEGTAAEASTPAAPTPAVPTPPGPTVAVPNSEVPTPELPVPPSETTAPETTAPETTAPETTAPETPPSTPPISSAPEPEPTTSTTSSNPSGTTERPAAVAGSESGSSTAADSGASGADADQPSVAGEVTVIPGDTLWSIAADRLPPNPTDSDIDNAWRAWYSANTQVIGDNPDLILPGQLLLPPDPEMGR